MLTMLKNFFFGTGSRKEETTLPEQQKADSYRILLECLQAASAALPEGKAYIVQANGEFTVSLTWKPEEENHAPSQIYGLDGSGKVSRWEERGHQGLFVEVPDEEGVPVKEEAASEKMRRRERQKRQKKRYRKSLPASS